MKRNKELKEVVMKMTWTEPLNPRDGFFCGRTGLTAWRRERKYATKMSHLCIPG